MKALLNRVKTLEAKKPSSMGMIVICIEDNIIFNNESYTKKELEAKYPNANIINIIRDN